MSTQRNKEIVQQMYSRFNEGDYDGAAALVADDLVNHSAVPQAQGRAGLRMIFEKVKVAFPDARMRIEELVAEGDQVVARLRMSGTNTGPIGFVHLPRGATGKTVDVEHIHIYRFDNGTVVESWGARDDFAMLRQLGVLESMVKAAQEA